MVGNIKTSRTIAQPTDDELVEEAIEIVKPYDRVSASLLQRRLSIGYDKASKLKVIGPSDGTSKPREVLIKNR